MRILFNIQHPRYDEIIIRKKDEQGFYHLVHLIPVDTLIN